MELLNHPLIAQRYFFPQPGKLSQPTWVQTSGGRLACWRSPGKRGRRPVLVHFHGNGELVSDWTGDFARAVQAMGWDLFLAEYRGYGESQGEPLLGEMLEDLEPIAQAVGMPQDQVVVFGRSVGSIFAVEWARRFPDCAGVVLESGIYDVYERLALRVSAQELGCERAEFRDAVRARLNHGATLAAYPGPCLVLHAEQDDLVSISHAERNARACGDRGQLVRFARGDHNSLLALNTQAYYDALRAFLARAVA